MAGNPPGSKWRSTPRAARKRKEIMLTLGPEALARLAELAEETGRSRSDIVDALLRDPGTTAASLLPTAR